MVMILVPFHFIKCILFSIQWQLPQRAVLSFYMPKLHLNHSRAIHITEGKMSYAANQQTLMVTRMLEEFLVSSEVHETQKGGLTRPPKISEVRGSSLKDSHLGWFYKRCPRFAFAMFAFTLHELCSLKASCHIPYDLPMYFLDGK